MRARAKKTTPPMALPAIAPTLSLDEVEEEVSASSLEMGRVFGAAVVRKILATAYY